MSSPISHSTTAKKNSAAPLHAEPEKQGWWRWWWGVVLAIIAIPTIIVIVLWIMLRSTPGYWKENQAWLATKTEQELQQSAQNLEQRITGTLTRVPVGNPGSMSAQTLADERTIHVGIDEANAWLATRLGPWLANRKVELPGGVKRSMITIERGQLVLAFEVESQNVSQIFSTAFDVKMIGDGKLQLTLGQVTTGKLPIPSSMLVQMGAQATNSQMMEQVQQMFAGKSLDPVMHIDETRNARLKNFTMQPDAIDLTFITEPRPAKRK